MTILKDMVGEVRSRLGVTIEERFKEMVVRISDSDCILAYQEDPAVSAARVKYLQVLLLLVYPFFLN